MAVRLSTGSRNAMLDSTGLRAALANCVLRIYSGAQPATADAAVTGTLLNEITVDGLPFTHGNAANGLNFDAASGGAIAKAVAETWKGNGLANGAAGWARLSGNPVDDGSESTTLVRIDFAAGSTGADLYLSNVNIVSGAPTTVDVCNVDLPST